jgi:hypothetical protein
MRKEEAMLIITEGVETIVKHHVCEHHKKHPQGDGFAGCTCSSVYKGKTTKLYEVDCKDGHKHITKAPTIWRKLGYTVREA